MALAPAQWRLRLMGSETLQQRIGYLLLSGQGLDCKFLVGMGTNVDQEAIEAHRIILAAASPVFDAMFYGEMAERQSPILIPDIQPETFRSLLKYIYVGDVDISSFYKAWELYYAAKKYILPYLMNKCTTYIASQLCNTMYIIPTYEFSVMYDEKELMDECLKLLGTKTFEISSDSSFNKAQLSTVLTIFSLEKINCYEMTLLRALERYAKAQEDQRIERSVDRNDNNKPLAYKTDSTDSSDSKDIVVAGANVEHGEETGPEEPRQQDDQLTVTESKEKVNIRPALEKIRFLTFTATEFAEGPALSCLLTESEKLAILMNITTEKSGSEENHLTRILGIFTAKDFALDRNLTFFVIQNKPANDHS